MAFQNMAGGLKAAFGHMTPEQVFQMIQDPNQTDLLATIMAQEGDFVPPTEGMIPGASPNVMGMLQDVTANPLPNNMTLGAPSVEQQVAQAAQLQLPQEGDFPGMQQGGGGGQPDIGSAIAAISGAIPDQKQVQTRQPYLSAPAAPRPNIQYQGATQGSVNDLYQLLLQNVRGGRTPDIGSLISGA